MGKKVKKRTKREHYLPQLLINRFAGNDGRVWCFDRDRLVQFQAVSEDICVTKDYYEDDQLKTNQIENGLNQIETRASKILDKLDELQSFEGLSRDELIDLSIFLTSLFFRTPFFENAMADGTIDIEEEAEYAKWIKRFQLRMITDDSLPIQFLNMKKYFIKNSSDCEFMLSDCPFIGAWLKASDNNEYDLVTSARGTLSLFDDRVALLLPIGPRTLLIFTHNKTLDVEKIQGNMTELACFMAYEMNRTYQRFLISRDKPHQIPN